MQPFKYVAALLFAFFAARHLQAEEKTPPNVVLIISDDQHFGDYGFMGSPKVETPRLDKLASQSLLFRRGYVTTSLCCPSLASIITGLKPRQSEITGNLPGIRQPNFAANRAAYISKMENLPTIPRLLATRGYLSLQTGKWWHGGYQTGGFTHGMTHGDPKRGGRHGDAGLTIGREGLKPIDSFIDEAISAKKPFFVWYAPFMPHDPHTPPERLLKKYRQKTDSPRVARYWAMCEWFDETCGELLDMLDKKHVADDTLVIYLCDNGWIAPREAGKPFAPRSKQSPYDGGLRTPMMIRYPGHVEPGEADGIAVNLDVLPTILDACAVDPPANLTGASLLKQENQNRREFEGAVYSHDAVDVDDPRANLLYRWRIEGRWKLIDPNGKRLPDESAELYDILADPGEQHDLAAEQGDEVARLRAKLADQ